MQVMPLEHCRNRACLSVRGLAREANVHPSTIWRIEHDKHAPMPDTRRQIARALGVDWQAIAWPQQRLS